MKPARRSLFAVSESAWVDGRQRVHPSAPLPSRSSFARAASRAQIQQTIPPSARCLFLKYPFAAHSSKSHNLGLGVLFLHRDASITDMHDCDFLLPFSFILQYIFAARNASRQCTAGCNCINERSRNIYSAATMPRRSILSAIEKQSLLALPDAKDELICHYTFSESDLSIIRQRRGP